MLDALSAAPYFAEGISNSPGALLHAVGHYPAGQEVDTTLIYGDYYFQEAVMRYRSVLASPDGGIGGSDGGMPPPSDGGLSDHDGGSPTAGPQGTSPLSGPPQAHGCEQTGVTELTPLGLLAVAAVFRSRRGKRLSTPSRDVRFCAK
jgi:hypothetical protein